LLKPLYEVHRKQILEQAYLQVDESKIKVLTKILKDKDGNRIKACMSPRRAPLVRPSPMPRINGQP
jgi:ribosomal protein L12E/L44/L45/RPP1/RPP2